MYKQSDISFGYEPQHMEALYQVYLANEKRKKELKKCIENFIEQQLLALRLKDDKENSDVLI